MFRTKVVEKIKTHILCSVFFVPESRAVYEIMWNNTVERGRPQLTVWRMHITCWIRKATHTRTEYVILIAFSLQKLLHERASVLRHTYIACIAQGVIE